ncbi:hypothetical protein D3C72_2470200 [compost metagenome]
MYVAGEPAITARAPSASCHMPRCISVSVEPGDTILQRILQPAYSSARHLVNIADAALDAA